MGRTNYDYLFKVLIIGDSGVGKSSLLLRYVENRFNENQLSTIGVDFKVKYLTLPPSVGGGGGGRVAKVALWDTAGQDRFRTLTATYYRGAHAVILVYDVMDKKSFDNIEGWLAELQKHTTISNPVKMIVGNKTDLLPGGDRHGYKEACAAGTADPNAAVSEQDGRALAAQKNAIFLETSAKTRYNVDNAFAEVILKIFEVPTLLDQAMPMRAGQPRLDAGPNGGSSNSGATTCGC